MATCFEECYDRYAMWYCFVLILVFFSSRFYNLTVVNLHDQLIVEVCLCSCETYN